MKKKYIALLFSGSFFLCCVLFCGFTGRVRSGVSVNGVEVGGMSFDAAAEAVRSKIARSLPPLIVHTKEGSETFSYPEITFTDNVPRLLRRARRGETLTAEVKREWARAEEEIARICAEHAVQARNADVVFSSAGFRYLEEKAGVMCNYEKTLQSALDALKTGKTDVYLQTEIYEAEITEDLLRAQTRPLSTCTTYFDGDKTDRVHNIRLASERVSGTVLPPHAEFSFNAAVGKRTTENGFRESVVIFDGEFVKGVGGGVCQASTTLFGAALRAGLEISESRAHSLRVNYVPPSLDAMVSEYSDLKFVNSYDTPVYIKMSVAGNAVKAEIFGLPDGKRYRAESVVLYRVPPPPEKIVEGDEDKTVRAEKEGIASESYLLVYGQDGTLLSRTLLRRDNYAVVQGIREVRRAPEN